MSDGKDLANFRKKYVATMIRNLYNAKPMIDLYSRPDDLNKLIEFYSERAKTLQGEEASKATRILGYLANVKDNAGKSINDFVDNYVNLLSYLIRSYDLDKELEKADLDFEARETILEAEKDLTKLQNYVREILNDPNVLGHLSEEKKKAIRKSFDIYESS